MTKLVADAGHERRLRADHGEVDLEAAREAEQALPIVRTDGMAVAETRNPGVAWGRVQLTQAGSLGELPGERVLTAPRTHDEHLHGRRVYSDSRYVRTSV